MLLTFHIHLCACNQLSAAISLYAMMTPHYQTSLIYGTSIVLSLSEMRRIHRTESKRHFFACLTNSIASHRKGNSTLVRWSQHCSYIDHSWAHASRYHISKNINQFFCNEVPLLALYSHKNVNNNRPRAIFIAHFLTEAHAFGTLPTLRSESIIH